MPNRKIMDLGRRSILNGITAMLVACAATAAIAQESGGSSAAKADPIALQTAATGLGSGQRMAPADLASEKSADNAGDRVKVRKISVQDATAATGTSGGS